MYKENAIQRINKINWQEAGKYGSIEDSYLAAEFLRRMALFSVDNSIRPSSPFLINIAKELGNGESPDNILEDCNKNVQDFLKEENWYIPALLKSYIQLSIMVDNNEEAAKYLEVYEPIIRLFERGGRFFVHKGFMDVPNVGMFPLFTWRDRAGKDPIDISGI